MSNNPSCCPDDPLILIRCKQDEASPACRYSERMAAVQSLHRPSSLSLDRFFLAPRAGLGLLPLSLCGTASCSHSQQGPMPDLFLHDLRRCTAHHPRDPHVCMHGVNLLKHVTVPVFVFSSIFDGWMLKHVICKPGDTGKVGAFGASMLNGLLAALAANPSNAGFIDACRHHTKCWADIKIDGQSPAEAFQQWFEGQGSKSLWLMNSTYGSPSCNEFHRQLSCPITLF